MFRARKEMSRFAVPCRLPLKPDEDKMGRRRVLLYGAGGRPKIFAGLRPDPHSRSRFLVRCQSEKGKRGKREEVKTMSCYTGTPSRSRGTPDRS
jgi:hypothetical protein